GVVAVPHRQRYPFAQQLAAQDLAAQPVAAEQIEDLFEQLAFGAARRLNRRSSLRRDESVADARPENLKRAGDVFVASPGVARFVQGAEKLSRPLLVAPHVLKV